jgi:hypothetical protein
MLSAKGQPLERAPGYVVISPSAGTAPTLSNDPGRRRCLCQRLGRGTSSPSVNGQSSFGWIAARAPGNPNRIQADDSNRPHSDRTAANHDREDPNRPRFSSRDSQRPPSSRPGSRKRTGTEADNLERSTPKAQASRRHPEARSDPTRHARSGAPTRLPAPAVHHCRAATRCAPCCRSRVGVEHALLPSCLPPSRAQPLGQPGGGGIPLASIRAWPAGKSFEGRRTPQVHPARWGWERDCGHNAPAPTSSFDRFATGPLGR